MGLGTSQGDITGELALIGNRIHVVGRKNHGKTRLVTALVAEFCRRGLKVGTIKHTHHSHELDTPGKDSWQHRQAGSEVVGILAGNLSAVFLPVASDASSDARYQSLSAWYTACDVVLVEGNLQTSAPKIEVWRESQGSAPLACSDPGIEVLVTDGALPTGCERPWRVSPDDLPGIADWILTRLKWPQNVEPECNE